MRENIFTESEQLKIKEIIQLVINETKKDFACVHHCEIRHMKVWGAIGVLFVIISLQELG